MALPWLRLYTEYATDPKIQILAFEDQRHFVMLLCLKGNGTLDCVAPNDAYRERLIAKALGLDPASATEAKRRLVEGGLIGEDWEPSAWSNRQCASDHDAAERKRRSRQHLAQASHNDVTTAPCDSHATDIDRDLDKTKKEIKTESRRARAARPPPRKRCPEDFKVTDDLRSWASARAPDVDVDRETERFRDWEYRHARTDWPAAWRTWLSKAQEGASPRETKATITWRPPPDDVENAA